MRNVLAGWLSCRELVIATSKEKGHARCHQLQAFKIPPTNLASVSFLAPRQTDPISHAHKFVLISTCHNRVWRESPRGSCVAH